MKSSEVSPTGFHSCHLRVLTVIQKEGPVTDTDALGSRQEGRERKGRSAGCAVNHTAHCEASSQGGAAGFGNINS